MKIGFVSLPFSGHLNPMTALARKLESRGNEVVFFGIPDAGPAVRAANLTFVPYGEKEYPLGSIAKFSSDVARRKGMDVNEYSLGTLTPSLNPVAFDYLPGKLLEAGIEALAIDILCRYLELIPMHMGIPYVQVCAALHVDFTGTTPLGVYSWPHETTPEALARNVEGLKAFATLTAAGKNVSKPFAEKAGLQINWDDPSATLSKVAVVTQTPKEFDFPNIPWPAYFHYTGPFHDDRGRLPIPFPWEKLNGNPLIYVSMGTLLNGSEHIYRAILKAVAPFSGNQIVLSVGHNVDIADLRAIPPNTIVVRSAPQIELLKRASLCITHAGLNTTLESLAQGVPMIAIPMGYDQPGIAARIAYHGAGEFIEYEDVTAERLSELIQQIQANPAYRDKARYFQEVIANGRGLAVAAETIELALKKARAENAAVQQTELSHV